MSRAVDDSAGCFEPIKCVSAQIVCHTTVKTWRTGHATHCNTFRALGTDKVNILTHPLRSHKSRKDNNRFLCTPHVGWAGSRKRITVEHPELLTVERDLGNAE